MPYSVTVTRDVHGFKSPGKVFLRNSLRNVISNTLTDIHGSVSHTGHAIAIALKQKFFSNT